MNNTKMQCRFIDTGFRNAFENMAIDEAILHYCEAPVLRVYGWKPRAVSIGYNQNLEEININNCKNLGIGIVRRITGGKAVFHDKELTYSFILPENINLLPREINEAYKIIANALVIALKKIGIDANIKKAPDKIKTPICFNSANWYELLANNKKISGSAQRRFSGKILQHGSLLMDFNYNLNSLLFNPVNTLENSDCVHSSLQRGESNRNFRRAQKHAPHFNAGSFFDIIGNIRNLQKRITSIKNESKNKDVNYNKLKEAIRHGFEENFNFEMADDSLSNQEIIIANRLKKEKYSTEEWNYRLLTKTI